MANIRMSRINSEIQKNIAEIIDRLDNPEIKGSVISVQKVNTSPDLLTCTIWVSSLAGDKDKILAAINSSKAYLRKSLASKLILKTMPELNFVLDTTQEYAEHMDKLFKEIETKDE